MGQGDGPAAQSWNWLPGIRNLFPLDTWDSQAANPPVSGWAGAGPEHLPRRPANRRTAVRAGRNTVVSRFATGTSARQGTRASAPCGGIGTLLPPIPRAAPPPP